MVRRSLMLFVLLIAANVALGAGEHATELQNPVKVNAAGKPIDSYGAAPFVGDFKGDGVLSLLVGEGDGKLRIYRNTAGANATPKFKFDNFTLFHGGKADGVVPASTDVGFTPQLVKREQGTDIISGSASGALYIFRGKEKGNFGPGEVIKDKTGKTINLGAASTVFAFDWRGTGKLDLLVGSLDGSVWLIPNESTNASTADSDQWGTARHLEAAGKAIKVPMGHSHPIVADWDNDGKPDLLVGTGAGSVLWYRNIGTRTDPKLAAAQTLVGESLLAANKTVTLKDNQWSVHAKIAVVDWNGTGKLDLLMGDGGLVTPTPQVAAALTPAQNTAYQNAKNELSRAEREYNAAEQKIKQLEKVPAKESAAALKEREKELGNVRKDAARYQKEIQNAQAQVTKYAQLLTPPPAGPAQYHGNVWLFQRKTGN
jgi:hypothetical protein